MSMYTHLLHAAVGERAPVMVLPSRRSALDAVRRCRGDLAEDMPLGTDPDAVSVVLAREIAYDLALLQLAAVMGVETDLDTLRAAAAGAGEAGAGTPRARGSAVGFRRRTRACTAPVLSRHDVDVPSSFEQGEHTGPGRPVVPGQAQAIRAKPVLDREASRGASLSSQQCGPALAASVDAATELRDGPPAHPIPDLEGAEQ